MVKEEISILSLGDSYTIGEAVGEEERFPALLAEYLVNLGFKVAPPEIIAKTGWTTADLLTAITGNPPNRKKYSIVTLLIGVNNQYQGKDLDEYRKEFRQLAEIALSFADKGPESVIVLSIPDYAFTPFSENKDREKISSEIDKFNKVNQEISQDLALNYLNITPLSRQGLDYPDLLSDDNLHPSRVMYKEWAEKTIAHLVMKKGSLFN